MRNRAAGIVFVNSASSREGIVPWMQMITDELGRRIRRPGREKALRKMLRAQAILAVAQNQTIKELEAEMRSGGNRRAEEWKMNEPWLTKREVAKELQISPRTVTRLKLPHTQVGGQNRYRMSEVEAVLAKDRGDKPSLKDRPSCARCHRGSAHTLPCSIRPNGGTSTGNSRA
jgi:hypothetical protein